MSTNHHHHQAPAYSNFFKSFDLNVKDFEDFKRYLYIIFDKRQRRTWPIDRIFYNIKKIPIDAENIYFEEESLTEIYFNIGMIDRLYYVFDNKHLRKPYRDESIGCIIRLQYKRQILYIAAITHFGYEYDITQQLFGDDPHLYYRSTNFYISEDANLFMNIIFNIDFFKEIKEKKDAIYKSLMSEGIRIYDINEPLNIDDDDDDDDCKKKNIHILKFICYKQISFHENKIKHRLSYLPNLYEQKVNAYIKYRNVIKNDINARELPDIIRDCYIYKKLERKNSLFSPDWELASSW